MFLQPRPMASSLMLFREPAKGIGRLQSGLSLKKMCFDKMSLPPKESESWMPCSRKGLAICTDGVGEGIGDLHGRGRRAGCLDAPGCQAVWQGSAICTEGIGELDAMPAMPGCL